ncbi:unnamed protein product [Closterium sp. Yama58-4]|nr:unnamed protein product [Closterium sp. Yama58-4]
MSFMRGDLLQKARLLMRGGVVDPPKWLDALSKVPPQPKARRCPKARRIEFPEDPLVESYYARHPEAKLQAYRLQGFDPPVARRFAWRQLELMQHHGLSKRQARDAVEHVGAAVDGEGRCGRDASPLHSLILASPSFFFRPRACIASASLSCLSMSCRVGLNPTHSSMFPCLVSCVHSVPVHSVPVHANPTAATLHLLTAYPSPPPPPPPPPPPQAEFARAEQEEEERAVQEWRRAIREGRQPAAMRCSAVEEVQQEERAHILAGLEAMGAQLEAAAAEAEVEARAVRKSIGK